MKHSNRNGFTLVEILVVVAIIGVIAAAAIAPLVFSVISIVDAEETYNEQEALFRVVSLLTRETAEAMRMAPSPVLRLIKNERLGEEADYSLIIASTSPTRQNLPAGSMVYRVIRRNAFSRVHEGLYRWVIAGKFPSEIDPEKLKEEEAQLVLTDISNLKIEAFIGSDWVDNYSGRVPIGMRFTLERGEQKIEQTQWFPM